MRTCPVCGATNDDDARFCSLCYGRFDKGASSSLAAPSHGLRPVKPETYIERGVILGWIAVSLALAVAAFAAIGWTLYAANSRERPSAVRITRPQPAAPVTGWSHDTPARRAPVPDYSDVPSAPGLSSDTDTGPLPSTASLSGSSERGLPDLQKSAPFHANGRVTMRYTISPRFGTSTLPARLPRDMSFRVMLVPAATSGDVSGPAVGPERRPGSYTATVDLPAGDYRIFVDSAYCSYNVSVSS